MIYFLSDFHLGFFNRDYDRERENVLLAVLEKMKGAERLVIVGDLFDYWFEYKTVVPKHFFRTIAKLLELKQSGVEIEYVMGNHDFGHKDFFEQELGILVEKEDIIREYYGKHFYISHGDGKSYKDTGYRILKRILRHPLSLWLYLKLHPNFAIGLASTSSKKSRTFTDKKDYGETDGLRDFALAKIDEGFDYVVMGHRHKAEKTKHHDGYYINLGHWIKLPGTFGSFDGDIFRILKSDEFISA